MNIQSLFCVETLKYPYLIKFFPKCRKFSNRHKMQSNIGKKELIKIFDSEQSQYLY